MAETIRTNDAGTSAYPGTLTGDSVRDDVGGPLNPSGSAQVGTAVDPRNRGIAGNTGATAVGAGLVGEDLKSPESPATRHPGEDANRDAITGAPGSHPIGTGVGAASAGAIGAAIGAVGGPIGAVVGAVVGAVAGGLAGKGVGEVVNPTAEDAYWRENYASRPYVQHGTGYEDYRPAFEYGWSAGARHADRGFDEAEPELQRDWQSANPELNWDAHRHAVRDSYERVRTGSVPVLDGSSASNPATGRDAIGDADLRSRPAGGLPPAGLEPSTNTTSSSSDGVHSAGGTRDRGNRPL